MKSFLLFTATLAALAVHAVDLSKDSTTWSVDDVVEWAANLEVSSSKNLTTALRKYGVTGSILMMVDMQDLEEDFEIKSSIERKKILAAIMSLKDTEAEKHVILGFWEVTALNRQEVHYLLPLLYGSPRWALWQLGSLPEYARPEQLLGSDWVSWFQWIFIPEYVIFANRNSIMGGLPGTVPITLLVALISKIVKLYTTSSWYTLAVNEIKENMLAGVLAWLYSRTLWHVVPWFLCDLFLYFFIWVGPAIIIISTVIFMFGAAAGAVAGVAAVANNANITNDTNRRHLHWD